MAEEAPWKYSPDGDPKVATDDSVTEARVSRSAPKAVSWTATEYIDHQQGPLWFAGLIAGTLLLAAAIYLLTHDYMATGFIVTLGVITGVFALRKPRQLSYELSIDGLKIEQKMYSFGQFRSFSIIQDGALVSLNLNPIKRFMPPISAYLGPKEQEKIINLLEDRLPYEERQLDNVERMTRRLRF